MGSMFGVLLKACAELGLYAAIQFLNIFIALLGIALVVGFGIATALHEFRGTVWNQIWKRS